MCSRVRTIAPHTGDEHCGNLYGNLQRQTGQHAECEVTGAGAGRTERRSLRDSVVQETTGG